MEQENKKESGSIESSGFEGSDTYEVVDWGNSDGFSLWNSTSGTAEAWLEEWEGRQETHDMFHNSYD